MELNLLHLSKYNLFIHTSFTLPESILEDNIIDCDAGFSNINWKGSAMEYYIAS